MSILIGGVKYKKLRSSEVKPNALRGKKANGLTSELLNFLTSSFLTSSKTISLQCTPPQRERSWAMSSQPLQSGQGTAERRTRRKPRS